MKPLTILILTALFLSPVQSVRAAQAGLPAVPSKLKAVVLTADMVHTAVDIESATAQATQSGTVPGIVILDGRHGPFIYEQNAEDVDINIFVSNLILQGKNSVSLHGGGINLDGMPLQNITIEDLEMNCPADCITSPDGLHRNVTIRNNYLKAGNTGIAVGNTDGWLIQKNRITAGGIAVHLVSTSEILVLNNQLQGNIAMMLNPADGCQVIGNSIYATWQGILLTSTSQANLVTANEISGVQASGIALEPDTLRNKVHGNRVLCAVWKTDCLGVEDWGTNNNTAGNP